MMNLTKITPLGGYDLCVIVFKQKGVSLPTKETFRNCFDNNDDGAGYMFSRNGDVIIKKGFMSFDKFWESFKDSKVTEKDVLIAHFRIATHGLTSQANTHPFPITQDLKSLGAIETITDIAVAHNGVISINTKDGMSDTFTFVKEIMGNPLIKDHLNHPTMITLLAKAIGGSRLALMWGNGSVKLIGAGWEKDEKGVMYSNSSYKFSRGRSITIFKGTNDWVEEYYSERERNKTKSDKFKRGDVLVCIDSSTHTGAAALTVGEKYVVIDTHVTSYLRVKVNTDGRELEGLYHEDRFKLLKDTFNKGDLVRYVGSRILGLEAEYTYEVIETGLKDANVSYFPDRIRIRELETGEEISGWYAQALFKPIEEIYIELPYTFDDNKCPHCMEDCITGGTVRYCHCCGRVCDENSFDTILKNTIGGE